MEILQYFIYFIIICAFVNIGGFIVSGLIRVYKSTIMVGGCENDKLSLL